MFRTFLSWRYLLSRKTNLIGMCGIGVAVFVLIVILSIMTGFLEENREAVRDGLDEITIKPWQTSSSPKDPGPLLALIAQDERILGAAVQLSSIGMLAQAQKNLGQLYGSIEYNTSLFVELLGVDLGSAERLGLDALQLAVAQQGALLPASQASGEFGVTEFYQSLSGEHQSRPVGRPRQPVSNPLFPFQPVDELSRGRQVLPGIVLGDDLAAQLRIEQGDVLNLSTVIIKQDVNKSTPVNRDFVVSGTFRSGHASLDRGRIYMDRRVLSELLQETKSFNRVVLKLKDYPRDSKQVVADLRRTLAEEQWIVPDHGKQQIQSWEETRSGMLSAIENERVMMGIMLSLILMVAGFTIFAILSMMVTEKRRDIGILLSLGATPRGILQVFLLVAFWDALVGALLGGLLGVWTALNITALERGLADNFGIEIFNRDVFLFHHIPSVVEPLPVALIMIWTFVCVLAFSAFPAWRAARMAPLDALRYE